MTFVLRLACAAVATAALFSLTAKADTRPAKSHAEDRAAQVTSALPAITQGDRTLRLSLTQWMDALALPGLSIAVIDDNRIVWAKGFGVATRGPTGSPVTPETIFQAASIAKPLTALAVLRQVDRGVFNLDADINDYLQTWKLPRSSVQGAEHVTIRRLLAHTGGITPGGFQGYARNAPTPTIQQVLEGAPPATNVAARVVSKPGVEVAYSGRGYTLLQLALEDRLHKPFEAILQDTVLRPRRLDSSTFNQTLTDAQQARAAHGHLSTGAVIEGGWLVNPEIAAAGLWTTPTDLAAFAIAVADAKRGGKGALLSQDLAHETLSPHRDEMGLGFVVRGKDSYGYFAHSGGNTGYFAHFEMLADTGQGIVIMTNAEAGQALASLIIAGVANAYDWPLADRKQMTPARIERLFAQVDRAAKKRTKVNIDPAVLARYVGKYELTPGTLFDITLADGQLYLRLGDQPKFPLFAESETKFFLEAVDAQITFLVDKQGRATALILHQGGRDQRAARIE